LCLWGMMCRSRATTWWAAEAWRAPSLCTRLPALPRPRGMDAECFRQITIADVFQAEP
jgi:hypothetical protein